MNALRDQNSSVLEVEPKISPHEPGSEHGLGRRQIVFFSSGMLSCLLTAMNFPLTDMIGWWIAVGIKYAMSLTIMAANQQKTMMCPSI